MCAIQRVILKYLSAFERGMVVGARRTGLSVSRTATLLGFSRSIVSRLNLPALSCLLLFIYAD